VLAITNRDRFAGLKEIPTAKEEGYSSLDFDGLVGIFASPEVSADIRNKIAKDVKAVATDPVILERMTATGQIVSPGDGAEFAQSIAEQKAQVAAVAKLFGGKPVQ
jgi:tripartite-type tricarboxylate transporter receptor subunit TctC